MSRKIIVFISQLLLSPLLLLIFCEQGLTWSAQGHRALGSATYRALAVQERQYLDRRMASLGLAKESRSLDELSTFADTYRDLPIEDFFKQFQAEMPVVFEKVAKQNTRDWHYYNHYIYPAGQLRCVMEPSGALRQRLLDLEDALSISREPKQEILLIALMLHLLQDLHQPLHTMSMVNEACRHDQGGNALCLRESGTDKRCAQNLHQLWDEGFTLWNRPLKIHIVDLEAQRQLRIRDEIDEWLSEALPLQKNIYQMQALQSGDPMYLVKSRDIVRKRADLAVLRTVQLLNTHIKSRRRNE